MVRRPDDWDEKMAIDPDRRWVLRQAFERSGYNYSTLGDEIECSHVSVTPLLLEPEALGGRKNTGSSELYTRACHVLGVPFWKVVKGVRPEQRLVLEALERIRDVAPDAYDKFIATVLEQAEDKARARGWDPGGEETAATKPPNPTSPPALRPVK